MVGRNELCPCGSGRKYKKCCLEKDKAKDIARNRIKLGEKQFDNVITKISESTSEDYKAYTKKVVYLLEEVPIKREIVWPISMN